MEWPYHFISLSPEQVAERRRLLDLYGWYGWVSPIVVLSLIYLGRVLLVNAESKSRQPTLLRLCYQRLSWMLNTPVPSDFGLLKVHLMGLVYLGWLLFLSVHRTGTDYMHFTKRLGHVSVSQLPFQYLLAIKSPWSPIQLATNLTHETLNPYHRLTGRIIHLLLVLHAALYINFFYAISALPGRFYDRDVRLGLFSLALLDILAYMALPHIRRKAYHKYFYISHAALSFLLIPAIFLHVPYTRKYMYQTLLLYMFNVLTRKLNTTAPETRASVTCLPGASNTLIRVSIPLSKQRFGSPLPAWMPGQHVYLKSGDNPAFPRSPFTIVTTPPRLPLPSYADDQNPYYGDPLPNMEFMVRNLGGPTTAWLAGLANDKTAESGPDGRVAAPDILVEGPYGTSTLVADLLTTFCNTDLDSTDPAPAGEQIILLLAGGIGATYTLPIYVSLLHSLVNNPALDQATKSQISQRVHFHWIVRSIVDAEWGIEHLRDAQRSRVEGEKSKAESGTRDVTHMNVTIHVTQADEPGSTARTLPNTSEDKCSTASAVRHEESGSSSSSNSNNNDTSQREGENRTNNDDRVLPPGIRIIAPRKSTMNGKSGDSNSSSSRPDLSEILNPLFTQPSTTTTKTATKLKNQKQTLNILTCAPNSLTTALRRQVKNSYNRWQQHDSATNIDTEVRWHDEGFGMGGSSS